MKWYHHIAFHALTASIVLNLVFIVEIRNIETGHMTVQPSTQRVSLIESIFP